MKRLLFISLVMAGVLCPSESQANRYMSLDRNLIQEETAKVADDFYRDLDRKLYDVAFAQIRPVLLTMKEDEQWEEIVSIHKGLKLNTSRRLANITFETQQIDEFNKVDFITLEYDSVYQRYKSVREFFRLYKRDAIHWQIASFKIIP